MLEVGEAMINNPILGAIRQILEFKNYATISEIAKIAEMKQRDVLTIVNRNKHLLLIDRKTGQITKEFVRAVHRELLKKERKYYHRSSYGGWTHEGWELVFDNPELKKNICRSHVTGGIGDSWSIEIVEDTPGNRFYLEAHGYREYVDESDDSLWIE